MAIGPTLGAELRAARERSGLGLREAARRLRIAHPYLIALERGERAPSEWTARRLVGVLALEGPTAERLEVFSRRVEAGIQERRFLAAPQRRPRPEQPPQTVTTPSKALSGGRIRGGWVTRHGRAR